MSDARILLCGIQYQYGYIDVYLMPRTNSPIARVSRFELELQQRVAHARRCYEQAVAEVRKLYAESRSGKLAAALMRQSEATREYSEALKALSDFVLGKPSGDLFDSHLTDGPGEPPGLEFP